MDEIFVLKVKDAFARGAKLADDIWAYKHPDESVQKKENDREYISWQNATPRVLQVAMNAGLGDLYAIFEMPTPGGGYVDVMLAGKNANDPWYARLLLVELKQWSSFDPVNSKDYVRVQTKDGPSDRRHPVSQLVAYLGSLKFNHSGLYKCLRRIDMYALAYLHNMKNAQTLLSGIYRDWANVNVGVYAQGKEDAMQNCMRQLFQGYTGDSPELLRVIDECGYIMSEAGLDGLLKALEGEENAEMVKDQRPIDDEIFRHLQQQKEQPHNEMILVSGGPGTGKTILGMHLIYDYAKIFGKDRTRMEACFCTPWSKTVRALIHYQCHVNINERGDKDVSPYLHNAGSRKRLVVIDEAHRLTNWHDLDNVYYVDKAKPCPTLVVVLQDDHQLIRPAECGTSENFEAYARNHNIPYTHLKLNLQKRCEKLGNSCLD